MKEILKIRTALSLDDYRNLLTLVRRAEAANANECDGIGLSHYLTATGAADVLHNQIGMSGNTVLLPLVSTLHEIGAVSIEEIARLFNSDLAEMTEYYKQLYSFSFTQENATDEQFPNFVISFARDIRVVIASVAAFYVRMQMVDDMPTCAYRPQMALFSRTFFAPLCHRLGLYDIKRVFEDLSVKYEHTDVYNAIRKSLKQTQEERDAYVEDFVKPLREKINLLNLPYKIKWRTKSIHSIYKKMQKKGIGVEGIYDLFAVRVILDVSKELEQAMCWAVFGLASSIYTPNTLRTKDWISRPKSSGYESLHTTVLGPNNHWVEIQIRSQRMDEIAEHGNAAHWRYKGVKENDAEVDAVLLSIREALEKQHNTEQLIKEFSKDLYRDEIFVFDNADKLHKLPNGSRIIDYIINIAPEPDWVELFTGANIGGEFKDFEYVLQNGDRVELVIKL